MSESPLILFCKRLAPSCCGHRPAAVESNQFHSLKHSGILLACVAQVETQFCLPYFNTLRNRPRESRLPRMATKQKQLYTHARLCTSTCPRSATINAAFNWLANTWEEKYIVDYIVVPLHGCTARPHPPFIRRPGEQMSLHHPCKHYIIACYRLIPHHGWYTQLWFDYKAFKSKDLTQSATEL